MPTDTIYGLVADARNPKAIDKIYNIKRRAKNKPLAVLVDNIETAKKIAFVDKEEAKILTRHVSEPITLLLSYRLNKYISPNLIYKRKSIGVRVSSDQLISRLVRTLNRPLVATSVNFSGSQYINDTYNIHRSIKEQVKVIVRGRKKDSTPSIVARIDHGTLKIIRGTSKLQKVKKIRLKEEL